MSKGTIVYTLHLSTEGLSDVASGAGSPFTPLDGSEPAQAASFFSTPMAVEFFDNYRFVFVCPSTGSPVGSVKLQACIDAQKNEILGPGATPSAKLTNWVDLQFVSGGSLISSFAVNGATTISLDENTCNYTWVRMVYTATSGSVTPTCRISAKGKR